MPNKRFLQGARAILPKFAARRAERFGNVHTVGGVEGGEDQPIQRPLDRLVKRFDLKGPRLLSRMSTRVIPVTTTDPSDSEVFLPKVSAAEGFSFNVFEVDAVASPIAAGGLVGSIRTLGPPGWYRVTAACLHQAGTATFRAEVLDGAQVIFLGYLGRASTQFTRQTFDMVTGGPNAIFRVVLVEPAVINTSFVFLDYTTRRIS